MSEISERKQLIEELQSIKERIKKIEDQLALSVSPSQEETVDTEPISCSEQEIGDIKPHEILTIQGIINLIHIGNRKPLEQFKLKAKIVVAATREDSKYGKIRPQEIIISDEKNHRFKLLNWHKSMDQKLKALKDQWVVFDSVFLKENDPRFPDNQFMFFRIRGEEIQFSIHSSKKFKIINYQKKGDEKEK